MDNIDLFFTTETWLHDNITNSMINVNNYEIIRSDRRSRRGGGVALFYKNYLHINEPTRPQIPNVYSNFEFICVDIKSGIRFLCFYIPPDSSKCPLQIVNVCKIISFYLTVSTPFILLGDFNLPKINWNTFTAEGNSSEIFLDFCIENGLTQCVNSATHKDGNILDLILCNPTGMSHLVSNSVDCPLSSSCDHNLLSITLSSSISLPNEISWSCPNFKNADYTTINQVLSSYDWSSILDNQQSLQEQYDMFISILQSVITEYVPHSTRSNKPKSNFPKHLRKLLKQKLKSYKNLKSGKCSKEFYREKAREYENEVKKWHEKIEHEVCSNPHTNKLYSYANKKLKTTFTLPPLTTQNNSTAILDVDKADLLNKTFHQNFTIDNNSNFSPLYKPSSTMADLFLTEADVLKAVASTKDKLSLTPENVPSYFIKRVISSILLPLLKIFNNSLKHSFVPLQWKQSIITPIFKKGNRKLPTNYRPIAQTSSFCRILESIISDNMLYHVFLNNLLLPNQYGFLPGRSSSSQLLYCLDQWFSSYFSDNIEYITYTDISKAFDTVSHQKLVKVLKSFGINLALTDWIKNFLTERSQVVRVNKSFSSPLPILSGVPQGSVLGPLLFILFMNDIVQLVQLSHNANFALFADDTKIFSTDAAELQSCLNSFNDTLTTYQLNLAPHKCFVLPIGKKSLTSSLPTHNSFIINSTAIPFEDHAKDLGILISSDLTWNKHVKKIVQQASFVSYQIIKSFRSNNIWTLLKLYKSYVRPKLEYNTSVWSPYLLGDIGAIERVQERFTKIICRRCNIPFTSYSDRLSKLNMVSLQNRRVRFDLITLFKIVNNMSDLNFNSFFHYHRSPYSLRGGPSKILPNQKFTSRAWDGSFFERAPRYWNKLGHAITSVGSLDVFKNKLNNVSYEDLIKTY